jgi:DNA-directed RNA polymerase delta subunit
MIEKAVNFLKRRFDRFKVNQFYDILNEIKKLLNIEKVEHGKQLLDKKFILWKHKRRHKWEEIDEYFPVNDILPTELSTKRKKKRRKLECILNGIKIPINENHWNLREGVIHNMLRKENIDELFLWNVFLRSRKRKKARLKPFIYGEIFEFAVEKEEELERVLKKNDTMRNILDLRICCDIPLEKKKKYKIKFKFKDKRKSCENFDPIENFFEVSKRMKKKLLLEIFNLFKKKMKMNSECYQLISEEQLNDERKLIQQENISCEV